MNNVFRISQRNIRQCRLLFICIIALAFSNCGTPKSISSLQNSTNNTRKLLLRDEGMSQLSYIDLADSAANWYVPIPTGRDMQLVGAGRVLVGTGAGYEEREITTGKKLFELTTFPGTLAARRLRNGNTLLSGVNWQGNQGIVLVEVDSSGAVKHKIVYPGFDYVRLVRETATGNFLITADNIVFEGNKSGAIIWKVKIAGLDKPHAWQALRLANGQTIVSTGYAKNFQVFSADEKLVDSITGPLEVNPNFYAGFQVLPNGNYIVANWQGHGAKFGASGIQVLEYTPQGKLAWFWKQDAARYSSLHAVIVLDGLDLNALHVEDKNGMLAPVNISRNN